MNQSIAGVSLAIFFAMVWLPLGQHAFMVEHWMKVGAFLAPILVFAGFKVRTEASPPILNDIALMASLFASAYLVHQVEEHWVDFLGREYPLYDVLNSLIATYFGEEKYGVMTPTAIFYINAGTVWTIAFVAILLSPKQIFPVLAIAGLIFVNGIAHILNAIAGMAYNSGLGTSILIFLPLSILFFRALLNSGAVSLALVGAAVLWGFLAHILLFAGLFAANVYGIIPEALYYVVLILWGLLPAFLFRAPS